MKSRKDQVQAHAYVVSRLTSALVHGEPDAAESPLRRTGLGSFGGLLLGTLLVAGFLIWGLIAPAGGQAQLTVGQLVLVNETGARYIDLPGGLRPVLNWSSALLLTGGNPAMTSVPATALTGIEQGQPLGIVGAPDALPAASSVNTGAWLVCNQVSGNLPEVSVSIGVPPPVRQLPGGTAVVIDADGTRYLLWHGQRLRIDASWIVTALGLNRAPAIPVNPAWLNSLPAGPDLRPLQVLGSGAPGPAMAGRASRVGQVLLEHNVASPDQYYLVESEGVAPITATQAAVVLTSPADSAAYGGGAALPIPVDSAAIVHTRQVSSGLADNVGVPATPPRDFTPGGGVPCMDYPAAGGSPPVLVFAAPPAGQPPAVGAPGVIASAAGASSISVSPGDGALVRTETAPGTAGNSFFLVTDEGVKFPLPPANVAALGYSTRRAAVLPSALLGLLPTGPALDLTPLRG